MVHSPTYNATKSHFANWMEDYCRSFPLRVEIHIHPLFSVSRMIEEVRYFSLNKVDPR